MHFVSGKAKHYNRCGFSLRASVFSLPILPIQYVLNFTFALYLTLVSFLTASRAPAIDYLHLHTTFDVIT